VGNASIPFSVAATVIRMMGEYIIIPTSAPTALDACKIAVGIGRVSADAFGVGGDSLPDAAGNAEYPWLYWAEHHFGFGDTAVSSGGAGLSVRKSFDVKSMRKFKPSENLVVVVQYVDITGTPPMTIHFGQVWVLLAVH